MSNNYIEDCILNDYIVELEKKGFKINTITSSCVYGEIFRCQVSLDSASYISACGTGFSSRQAHINALVKLVAAIEDKTYFFSYHLGKDNLTDLKPDNFVDADTGSDLLFDNEIRSYYQLEDFDPRSFADCTSFDDQHILFQEFKKLPCNSSSVSDQDPAIKIPLGWLHNIFHDCALSLGKTPEDASLKALMKMVQNHLLSSLITDPKPLPLIPLEQLTPKIQEIIQNALTKHLTIKFYDPSCDAAYPAVAAALFNSDNQGLFFAIGVADSFEKALEDAILQLFDHDLSLRSQEYHHISASYSQVITGQNISRILQNQPGLLPVGLFVDARKENEYHFSTNTNYQDLAQVVAKVQQSFIKEHLDIPLIYQKAYQKQGVCFCQSWALGYGEMADPQMFDGSIKNAGNIYRDFIFNLENQLPEVGEFLDSIAENEIADDQNIAQMLGLKYLPNDDWESFTISELKALIAMAQDDPEPAYHWIQDYLKSQGSALNKKKHQFYVCCMELLRIRLDEEEVKDYQELLYALYDAKLLKQAIEASTGQTRFYNYQLKGSPLKYFPLQQELVEVYQRLYPS